MVLAAHYGFRSITGIDFAPVLCRCAERNIALFQPRVPGTRFEVMCGDATDYQVRPDDCVFYFYDPFHDDAVERCLARIAASIDERPRPVFVIYHNNIAVRPTPFDTCGWLAETPFMRFDGNAFYLFSNSAAAGHDDSAHLAGAR
jgi:hypothetical protein